MTSIDAAVDEKEAQTLMLHHLRLASAMFEVLPGSLKVHRAVLKENLELEFSPWVEAALAWFDKLDELYMEDDKNG